MSQIPHIAVVDDEKLVREMVGDFLLMRGYTVSLCESGASLDEVMAQQKPDLIVLDLRLTLPRTGFRLFETSRGKRAFPSSSTPQTRTGSIE
jgi:DNA-binding response OmpR family regulator